ncbi:hypothetical protein [Paraglaciecola sp. 2405UD69-4]|uniref:hypothetical protein n=1 Tax=Paraglaciecola sp. 2405UD69-4 TaxID=3391836 RepID=UPI0039C93FF1
MKANYVGKGMKKVNRITRVLSLGCSLVLMLSMPCMATQVLIEKLDLDKDGHITIREAVAEPKILVTFGTIDRNNDGKISKTELKKAKISSEEKRSTLESS